MGDARRRQLINDDYGKPDVTTFVAIHSRLKEYCIRYSNNERGCLVFYSLNEAIYVTRKDLEDAKSEQPAFYEMVTEEVDKYNPENNFVVCYFFMGKPKVWQVPLNLTMEQIKERDVIPARWIREATGSPMLHKHKKSKPMIEQVLQTIAKAIEEENANPAKLADTPSQLPELDNTPAPELPQVQRTFWR